MAKGILPPGIAGHDPNLSGYGYDPEQARRLLSAAGFPDGRGFPPVRVWTPSQSDNAHRQLEAVRRYLAAVGLELDLHVADSWQAFVQALTDGEAHLFQAGWYADYPDADNFLYPLTHSSSTTNWTRLDMPEVDRLLERARTETDYQLRVDLYGRIERMVMDQAPLVALYNKSSNYVFQPWVRGIELSRMGGIYLPYQSIRLDARTAAHAD